MGPQNCWVSSNFFSQHRILQENAGLSQKKFCNSAKFHREKKD
jgi:hypothetical protein